MKALGGDSAINKTLILSGTYLLEHIFHLDQELHPVPLHDLHVHI